MTVTLPTWLTIARLAAAPLLVVPFLLLERPAAYWTALALFAAAALTDFLDGWLARRLGQESRLGAVLDPIADKAMVATALALLLWVSPLAPWLALPAAVILFREVLVSGLREAVAPARLDVTPLAKIKTALQMLAVGALLFAGATGFGEPLGAALLAAAAVVTAVTGWDYARKAVAHLGHRED